MPDDSITLNIMSYNIRHGRGMDDRVDLDRIAGVIARSGADIIGIQEADDHWSERSFHEDQTRWLGEKLGMHYVFGGSIDWDPTPESGGRRRKHGTAVLSKYTIAASRQRLFSTCVGNHRELLEAKIEIGGQFVYFFSTHWGLDGEERMVQAKETIQWMKECPGARIVVGDFNATPDSPEIRYFGAHYRDAVSNGHMMNTFPAERPIKRIDYIFGSEEVRLSGGAVIHTLASDHLPFVCVAAIRRRVPNIPNKNNL
ncbi:endonuclease/exonuclease/phosphatase family protein [Paenibacillus sp. HJGM_3]|uniref:endonuclease/exonuclease/phosphatase family protein n=1 Tax=Paenibacillus sp. HJGM_3 TaxID=3379816 RepID=UPI00386E2651